MAAPSSPATTRSPQALRELFSALESVRPATSVLIGRAGDDDWPPDAEWATFLEALPLADVEACEKNGLHWCANVSDSAPTSLKRLCEAVRAASQALGRGLRDGPHSETLPCAHRAWRQSAEKSTQVSALLASVASRLDLSRVRRVVDVGCGKGHLVARLSSALGVPALGIDVDEALLATARATYPAVEAFECRDVVTSGLGCVEGDLVVGLHPCGALGETIVRAVGEHGGCALLMVPCCWHKQGSAACVREPLSACAQASGLRLPLAALKKASMALDATASVGTRRARHELRELLRARGVDEAELAARREMDGIHPKKARRGVACLAAEALRVRGLAQPEPSEDELRAASAAAAAPFERVRRLSLLEPTLGELIELTALLDRALALQEHGMRTSVFSVFSAHASDRNLCVVCEPEPASDKTAVGLGDDGG